MKLLFLALFLLAAVPATAATPYQTEAEATGQVQRDFATTLDLWRDGRYDEVYARALPTSLTRERFAARLASAARRPSCCWEKLQEVRVTMTSAEKATLHAKVGLEGAGSTDYATRSFRLENDGGIWKIPAADILSLAGNGGNMKSRKKARH